MLMVPRKAIQAMQEEVVSEFYDICTSFETELRALLSGIEWCQERNLFPLIIHTDSKLLVQVIKGECQGPRHMTHLIRQLLALSRQDEFVLHHQFRETNAVVDPLVKMASSICSHFSSCILPRQINCLVVMDVNDFPIFDYVNGIAKTLYSFH
ncbi:hypothetical protein ACH5RR_000906 [Cinchona calisaya]|uniref:RNase H type-1 domain-containing protein n=1 Tax=Cinchona calisaya TaxID=153742 RepID=A0ABD3B1Y6_9GENT